MSSAEYLRPLQPSFRSERGSSRWKKWVLAGAVAILGISLIIAAA